MKNIYLTLSLLFCLSVVAQAQVPKLNSYPAASAVVFLDFDGHIVQGTSWNYNGPVNCEGSNLNSTQITEIFNRVAEDYRPFNINVTTDSTVYQAAPARKRMRVVLTISSSWYGSAGGVSFTNSFTWGDNTPCFVFTALLKYNVKNIAEAASHEVGHTLGLNHQSAYDAACAKTAEYNSGTGSGETSWAPIMGVGYYRNLTLWHYGSNPYGCSYMQDDLGIITNTTNGFGYRADDHGSSAISATTVSLANNQFTVNGVIEKPNDADVFTFSLPAKTKLQVNSRPFSAATGYSGANIDLQMEIINSTGTDTVVYNPATTLESSVDTVLSAGTWFVRVISKGNTYAPNFASLGSYTVNATLAAITLPVHKLDLKAASENGRHQLGWEIVADENVVSQTLEVSGDGTTYQSIASLPAAARDFTYVPVKSQQHYYRLRVSFDNGRTHYTNVVLLRTNAPERKPYLMGNVVSGNLAVNSPAAYQYAIFDLNGRQVVKGQLVQGFNSIATPLITHGLYVIRFTNNLEQYTEKFSKR